MLPRRFGLLVLSLLCLTIATVAVVKISATVFARPRQLFTFNPPGCYLPCILGITPGVTDGAPAQSMVETLPLALHKTAFLPDQTEFLIQNADGSKTHINWYRTDPRRGSYVSYIRLATWWEQTTKPPQKVMTFGDLLDAGYLPTQIYRNQVNGMGVHLLITFGNTLAVTITETTALRPQSLVDQVYVIAPEDADWQLSAIRAKLRDTELIRWLGFAPISDYLHYPAHLTP